MTVEKLHCKNCRLNCYYLGELDDDELERYNANRRLIQYKKGETIFKQGSFIAQIIFIRSGLVKLTLEGSNKKNHIVKIFKKHAFVGLPFLFGNNQAHFTAVVMKNTEVCMIEKDYLQNLIGKNQILSNNVMKKYALEFEDMYERFNILGTKSLQGRLAEVLLYLNSDEFEDENIFECISRKDLAELSAMSLESMLRILNDFKTEGFVSLDGKTINILNPKELIRISNET